MGIAKAGQHSKTELYQIIMPPIFAELDQLLANALTRDPATGEWMCKYCPKTHKNKARISRHAETHFPGFSQQCNFCDHVAGSRNSLRAHVSYHHTAVQAKQNAQQF